MWPTADLNPILNPAVSLAADRWTDMELDRIRKRPRLRKDAAHVPIATVGGAPRLLAEAGADADATARAAALDPRWLDDWTRTISFADMGRYLVECIRASRDETFALRVGLAGGPSALTALGYLAQHSPDVRTSLDTLRTYAHQFSGAVSITQRRGVASLEYSFLLPSIEGAGLIAEAGVGVALSILRQLCGPAWTPIEVRFARGLPDRPSRWRQFVHAPVYFGAERNVVSFSAKWLDQRVEHADPELRRILHDRVAELDTEYGEDFSLRVSSIIRSSLLAGDASPAHVSSRLAISPRTLRRRLAAYGTNFESLLDTTRFDVAGHLLTNSAASMTQIAELLGFAHSSAYSRAFRRWTGTSPQEWRKERVARSAPVA
jgi:AraC-like DNA-binding protein